ncbi:MULTISPECIES: hypothetical protein [Kosakonia]|uniref:EcpB family pilus assembly chaperone n=1 Tax=Kosakonia TaxID=1330547 RepID=UPI0005EDA38B|nr:MULTISPECIES: hypothetical protein [Kosakonia]RCX00139.1 hypothetical protein DFO56_106102 [Kosakonia sp. AG348]
MRNVFILFFAFLVFNFSARALDVGDISTFISSDRSVTSKEIKNTTTTGRLVNVRIEKVSSPLDDGVTLPMDNENELLLTPGSLLMPANSKEVIRFFYHGPQDDKERYYRIVWLDQALSDATENGSKRNAVATASARISTILVVVPRKVNFSHHYRDGKIINNGNATLRVIAYGPCQKIEDGESCRENYYVMPGKSRIFSRVNVANKKGHVALWQSDQFVPIK